MKQVYNSSRIHLANTIGLNVAKPIYLTVPEIKLSTSFNLPVSETQAMTLTLGLFSPVNPHSPNPTNTRL